MLKSEELINKVREYNKFLNPTTLTKAYNFALEAHKKQNCLLYTSDAADD